MDILFAPLVKLVLRQYRNIYKTKDKAQVFIPTAKDNWDFYLDVIKDKQLQKIGKLADKHGLATWDEKVLDKAFSFIKESGVDQFVEKGNSDNS